MKRLAVLLALLVALGLVLPVAGVYGSQVVPPAVTTVWEPPLPSADLIEHELTGEGSHWAAPRSILVVDEVIRGLPRGEASGNQRRRWRKRRDATLREWAVGGFSFAVHEGVPHNCGYLDRADYELDQTALGSVRVCGMQPGPAVSGWATWETGEGQHILRAVAVVGITQGSTPARWILCHELGHVLGLGHRFEPGGESSCMSYSTALHPDAHDYEQLARLHAHAD